MEKFYRPSEVASLLQVNVYYLYRLVKAGRIRATPIGRRGLRFTQSQIDRFLESQNKDHQLSETSTGTKG